MLILAYVQLVIINTMLPISPNSQFGVGYAYVAHYSIIIISIKAQAKDACAKRGKAPALCLKYKVE